MKLWVLGEVAGRPKHDRFSYDNYHGFVIRAETEAEAREAAKNASIPDWYEEEDIEDGLSDDTLAWLDPNLTFCREILKDGEQEIILSDYRAG